jgi:hypothetical protein
MSTAPIRSSAKRRLYDLTRDALTGVQVTYAEPMQFEPLCVWFGETKGATRPAGLKSGRKTRFDDFTIAVHCMAMRSDTDDWFEVDDAVEGLWAAVDSILADDPFLSVDGSGLSGLIAATADTWDGPIDGFLPREDQVQTITAEIIGQVQFKSRLT